MTIPVATNGDPSSDEAQVPKEEANTKPEPLDPEAADVDLYYEDDDNNNDNDETYADRDPSTLDARELKIRNWQQSPFAVGCVNVTWADDRRRFRPDSTSSIQLERNPKVCFSAYVCGCLGARRVGNLAVLAQTTEEYDHVEIVNTETGEQRITKRKRPKLLWVLGPYWPVNFFLTYPLIIGISFLIGWTKLPGKSMGVIISWSLSTFLLVFSLAMIACRNPGVLYRHRERPPNADDWRWNDQAKTYRPPKARFDPECQVVIEGFDHTCPWTGTAIGSRNMFWFRIFVTMVPVNIAFSVVLSILNF